MPTANTSFSTGVTGYVRRGQTLPPGDPRIQGREHLFEPLEQATAGPGEKRAVRRADTTDGDTVSCPVDGCDYEGTSRGLAIHAGSQHKD